jgi:hypothetical protein
VLFDESHGRRLANGLVGVHGDQEDGAFLELANDGLGQRVSRSAGPRTIRA